MQKIIGIDFKIYEKDYIQLFSNMPALKRKKYSSTLTILIISVTMYFLVMLYTKTLDFTTEQYNAANLFTIAVYIIITLLVFLIFNRKYKKLVYTVAKEKYCAGKGNDVHLVIDKDSNIMKMNKRAIPLNEKILILSTLENYLVYIGKKIDSEKIFLPKNGDSEYKESLNEMIDYLQKTKNAKIIVKNI